MEIIILFGLSIIFFIIVFVYKLTHGYGRPYSKKADTEEKDISMKNDESLSAIENAVMTGNLYNLAKGGCGTEGISSDEEFDEAQYRAYREELAAYDDFVASLDMDD
jgi:hypothetical protein